MITLPGPTVAQGAYPPIVLDNPSARDKFQLDGIYSPGISKISGGETKDEIVDQKQPLTAGANTVVRSSLNTVITYELTLWTRVDLQSWAAWEAMFLEGRTRRPPRVYKLTDGRFSWMPRVVFESMTPEEVVKPGGPWKRTVTLHQYNRVAPYGGPLTAPSPQDIKNDVLRAANADKSAQLAKNLAAARATKS